MGSEQIWTWLPVVLLGLTGVPQIQTATWLLRNLSKTSSKWKLKGGCFSFPQNTLLTPFFLSSSISQSFHSPTFILFFLLSTCLGGKQPKKHKYRMSFLGCQRAKLMVQHIVPGSWTMAPGPSLCPESHDPHGHGLRAHGRGVSAGHRGGCSSTHHPSCFGEC